MTIVDTLKVYLRHPKCIVRDMRFYTKKYKEKYEFWFRKKLLKRILESDICSYTYEMRHQYKPFNRAMLFPCSVVSMVLAEYFQRVDLLGIHSISVDTQSDEAVTATIALARPGLLIGKGGLIFINMMFIKLRKKRKQKYLIRQIISQQLKLTIGDNTILTLFNDKDLHNSKKIITFAL